ncbi:hypothetical protein BCR36DRAFT_8189 [Piromyces finnis]|uniref:Uncharacterized protein n=1 Tax=Piromyces finnis TaxID=1754191 RepID=A0A1Y1VP58_9FUNG|nr:hypothetical protein BCR36DRAFT_8189 [Piromyces finnis]|eukprot:ORX61198.1 hypothetical protein BCR36DRAFT_8189 [Piromyces finnis]
MRNNNTEKHDSKNKEMLNIISTLQLKKYESNLFHIFVTQRKNSFPTIFEVFFSIIEVIQLYSIFYNEFYMPKLPSSISAIFSIVTLRNIFNQMVPLVFFGLGIAVIYIMLAIQFIMGYGSSKKLPNWAISINSQLIDIFQRLFAIPILFNLFSVFGCSSNGKNPFARYICFDSNHNRILLASLIILFFYLSFAYMVSYYNQVYVPLTNKSKEIVNNKTIIIFRRILAIEFFNIFIVQVTLYQPIISSIIMFIGWAYLLYHHYNNQIYFSQMVNCFYSSLWFSLALVFFVNIFFILFGIEPKYSLFFGLTIIGVICGWFINNIYSNWYIKRIVTNIEKKYNQQHIISRLKEQIEMDRIDEDEKKSIDTIFTEKRVVKKEKVFKKFSDCAYVSKFIMKNRSIESFNLVNSIFKEGLSQFDREPEFYLQYWNYLHGMRRFISINKQCFLNSDADDFLRKIDDLSEKVLTKCANLSKSLTTKYLIYNATIVYGLDKPLLNNDENGSNNTIDYELVEIRNSSIQYHIAALNGLKNLMIALRTLDSQMDIDNAMKINDELTEILNNGESIFKKFVFGFNYSRESLEFYILFLRNSLNRGDLAEQYIQILEDNEQTGDGEERKISKNNGYAYEKSEKMSSSMASDMENKKTKILKRNMLHRCQKPLYKLLNVIQVVTTIAIAIGIIGNIIYRDSFLNIISHLNIYSVAAQSPAIMSEIKNNIRLMSLNAAGSLNPTKFASYSIVTYTLEFLSNVYIPTLYPIHSVNPDGLNSIHPVGTGVVDEIRDLNYFRVMMKIQRKAEKIVDGFNKTEIFDPSIMYNRDIRFFTANLKGQFGSLFLESLDLMEDNIKNIVNSHLLMFYLILGIVFAFMAFIIFEIIIPNSDKSSKFIKNIVCLYKTLPGKYFHEQSNEYMDQIKEICENYDVDDEGIAKNIKKKKNSSTSAIKRSFILYCIVISILLIVPFLTVFIYQRDTKNLLTFLVNSTKRSYYVNSINHYCKEALIKDKYYYSEGEELRILNDHFEKLQTLENNLKNGKYGGKDSSGYAIFRELNNNPGCVRSKYLLEECNSRKYDNEYTEKLANSPLSYIMIEYINKVKDYINNIPERNYDLTNSTSIRELNLEILNNKYFILFKNLGSDINGHIDVMNELGSTNLLTNSNKYLNITLMSHIACSILLFITFFIYISGPIKKQLRIIDSLTNITFSIPSSVYNSSPKIKNFIENGKLE